MPEAGFELDSFPISGLPRRPGVELVRSIVRAGGAVRESRRILKRRRPDVVLGAGSYVAGPMVLAAATMRIPTALTEADAHLGLANRLAAPFAERVFLSYELDGRGPPKYLVVGRPIPERSRPLPRAEARQRLGLPPEAKILGVFGARAGAKSLNEFAVETWGESGPVVLHLSGERDHDELQPRVRRPRLPPAADRSRTSEQRSRPSISPCRGPAEPSGSWRRRGCLPCSFRTRMRRPTTRRRTLATSSGAAEPSSCPSRG